MADNNIENVKNTANPEVTEITEITGSLNNTTHTESVDSAENAKKDDDDKWEFADYAYIITGVLVGFLLVVPDILYSQFGISILGGSLGNVDLELFEELEYAGSSRWTWDWTITELRALSPMLFLLTTTIVFFQDAFATRKTGEYKGSMFTHTFESLFEESIYMAITTIMVYSAILMGAMYISWLAGPITWIIFVFIFPLVKKKSSDYEEVETPWLTLFIFASGLIAEVITGAWIAFPLAWLIICAIKLVDTIRNKIDKIDRVFDVIYYAFSVILMALGIFAGFWIASWAAFPIGLLLCWLIHKFGIFNKPEAT